MVCIIVVVGSISEFPQSLLAVPKNTRTLTIEANLPLSVAELYRWTPINIDVAHINKIGTYQKNDQGFHLAESLHHFSGLQISTPLVLIDVSQSDVPLVLRPRCADQSLADYAMSVRPEFDKLSSIIMHATNNSHILVCLSTSAPNCGEDYRYLVRNFTDLDVEFAIDSTLEELSTDK